MKCIDCIYCIQIDNGYSNWTVEGTDVDCLLNLNPKLPEDKFYGEEGALNFAKICKKFTYGEGVYLDVERELLTDNEEKVSERYSDNKEIKKLLDVWEKKKRG